MDELEDIGQEVAFIEEIRQQELERARARGDGSNKGTPDRPGCLFVLAAMALITVLLAAIR